MSCPFCIKAQDQSILSSANFIAIYNIAPVLPGHCLVIPKKHIESFFDLGSDELAEFMTLGRNVAKLLTKALNTDAFDWAIQEKEAAGQSVPHLHMHIVPRYIGDLKNPGDWYQELEKNGEHIDSQKRKKLSDFEMNSIVNNLKTTATAMQGEFL